MSRRSPILVLLCGATLASLLLVPFLATSARAQDTFEIQVYEYETVPKGMWDLEMHLNYVGRGTKVYEGPVAPTNNQFHLTYELTHGITDHFEMAGYLLLAHRPGGGYEYAGARVRPRFRLPKSWHLPVDISLSGEVGFPSQTYEENSVTVELRPIIEKKFRRWQFDFNPTIARALRGPGSKEGWEFEPAARIGYETSKRLDLSLEYYGATGPIKEPLPRREQVHQLYPGCDLNFGEKVVWNFGIGFATTPAGSHLVYKSRLGILFGKKRS